MGFTDKVLAPINERIESMSADVEVMKNQLAGLAGLGMIAFALISIVAVTALVKASK
jgi:hypothetical protein